MQLLTVFLPPQADRLATPQPRRSRRALAVALAVAVHAVVFAALVRIVVAPLRPPAEQAGYALVMAPADSMRAPAPLAAGVPQALPAALPSPATPTPVAAPPTAAAQHVAAVAPPRAVAMHRPVPVRHQPAATALAGAAPQSAPGAAPIAAPAVAAPAPDPGPVLAQLKTRIDQAVRAAAFMPEMAVRQRREGRAQVRFNYLDGAVDGIQVVQSSQSRVLDDAAIRAVRQASYPPVPGLLRGRRLDLQVWIDFRLATSQG